MTGWRRPRHRAAGVTAGLALGAACMQTVTRGPDEPVGGPREVARVWRVGGFHRAAHVVDPAERPLRGHLAPDAKRPLWPAPLACYCCAEFCEAGLPRCEWIPIASVVVSRH